MAEQGCACGHYPTILLPGIGQSRVDLVDENGTKLRSGWPLDLDQKALIKPVALPALLMLLTRMDLGLTRAVAKGIRAALDPLTCLPDGTRKHRVRVVSYPYSLAQCSEEEKKYIFRMVPVQGLADTIGWDHLYFYAYDIFGEIDATVRDLDAFIQQVKAETGHDKVNLMPVSMGGTLCTAYFADYGAKGDVHRVVGAVPAYLGSHVVADLLNGNIDADDYESLFVYLLGNKDGKAINKYVRYVPRRIVKKLIHTLLKSALDTVLRNSTTMWGLVPAYAYEGLRDRLLCDPAQAGIRQKLDHYYETVRKDLPAFVRREQARGVSFFSLCGYHYPLFRAIRTQDMSSDGIVPVLSASMGAHCAPLGQTLPEGYRQQNSCCQNPQHNHISPDRLIDASCGAMPDSTWFYKNMEHEQAADNKELLHLCCLLLQDDSIKDVFSDPAHPQFQEYIHKK